MALKYIRIGGKKRLFFYVFILVYIAIVTFDPSGKGCVGSCMKVTLQLGIDNGGVFCVFHVCGIVDVSNG